MSNRGWTFKKHVMLSFSITMVMVMTHYLYILMINMLLRYEVGFLVDQNEAASVAIIGGADGPTAVYGTFISNSVMFEYIFFFLILLLLYSPIKSALNNAFRA